MKKILILLTILILLSGCNSVICDNKKDILSYDLKFSKTDLDSTYNQVVAHNIEFNNQDIYIYNAGTYVLSGELMDHTVFIDCDKTDKVQLVLDNVDMSHDDFACIYILEADKVIITLKDNSVNKLVHTHKYSQIDDNEVDAVIYSKADLTINGSGCLHIEDEIGSGIVSKDDLIFVDTNVDVGAMGNGVEGKDAIKIRNTNLNIKSGNNALRSDNSDNKQKGFVYIESGDINIEADDHAIQGYSLVYINNGNINIPISYEGIEGNNIIINDGKIDINAIDDGINACDKAGFEMHYDFRKPSTSSRIEINGGYIHIDAQGDGFDSNGDILINNGTVYIDGPTGCSDCAFDYETGGYINGGETIMVGSSYMSECPSEGSKQNNVLYIFADEYPENSDIEIINKDEVIMKYTSLKTFDSIIFSCDKFDIGDIVTIKVNDDIYQIEIEDVVSSNSFLMHWRDFEQNNGMPTPPDKDFDHGVPFDKKPDDEFKPKEKAQ